MSDLAAILRQATPGDGLVWRHRGYDPQKDPVLVERVTIEDDAIHMALRGPRGGVYRLVHENGETHVDYYYSTRDDWIRHTLEWVAIAPNGGTPASSPTPPTTPAPDAEVVER